MAGKSSRKRQWIRNPSPEMIEQHTSGIKIPEPVTLKQFGKIASKVIGRKISMRSIFEGISRSIAKVHSTRVKPEGESLPHHVFFKEARSLKEKKLAEQSENYFILPEDARIQLYLMMRRERTAQLRLKGLIHKEIAAELIEEGFHTTKLIVQKDISSILWLKQLSQKQHRELEAMCSRSRRGPRKTNSSK